MTLMHCLHASSCRTLPALRFRLWSVRVPPRLACLPPSPLYPLARYGAFACCHILSVRMQHAQLCREQLHVGVLTAADPLFSMTTTAAPSVLCLVPESDSLQGMDIVMHGGEYYDGGTDKMHVYGDVFVYSTSQATWKQVSIPGG